MEEDVWTVYKNLAVRLILEDSDGSVRKKDGVFYASDESHVFIFLERKDVDGNTCGMNKIPTPFRKKDIKRVETKENGSTKN